LNKAIGGSTNYSWRGWMVQNNNAVVVEGEKAIAPFLKAFDNYFDKPSDFASSDSAIWDDLQLAGVDAKVTFSPHSKSNAVLESIGEDMGTAESSLFYSLAFLSQTSGAVRDAVARATRDPDIFVYGISNKRTKIELLKPDGNPAPVFFAALGKNVPEPFKSEPTGGGGISMHHKFVVIDFDKPTARVYLGSYNFSGTADSKNGENLFLIKDARVATSYMIEALRIFDHYAFRVAAAAAKKKLEKLQLKFPPKAGEEAWWKKYYTDPRRIKERQLFA
jgi:phosphatidylserine/phosphatidylglycerophosphate/cardiolipin synthase-like enzyme